ncbi:MAG: site-specific DNA-methyltransferase [Chloroflexota bacterium]|nr:site-specific DNA-methyltransferase [Chloroflexota bacterium]
MTLHARESGFQTTFDFTDEPNGVKQESKVSETLNRSNLGTFQDSLRAPIHRWFTYPAGFSYKAVEEAIRAFGISRGMTLYDPFAGTATTNVVAKQQGINSFGVEAHPFVQFVARTKLYWEFDLIDLFKRIAQLLEEIQESLIQPEVLTVDVSREFPELVSKCYSPKKLTQLYVCREAILKLEVGPFQDFAKLALTNVLRSAADVATGWPYIAPNKVKNAGTTNSKVDIMKVLRDQFYVMHGDLQRVQQTRSSKAETVLIAGDSRDQQECIVERSVDLSFTSPPYLNNYDYADRTRLEMYFWGEATSWGDITRKVRTRLITSATTQIERSQYSEADLLTDEIKELAPAVSAELKVKTAELSKRRLTKGGKKSYDILVAGYFNDMLRVVQETFRILKPGASFLLILGDSAPYGVYIPTDIYLGEIGKAVGFSSYEVEDLRTRGGKWKDNPQRHDVPLKECILTLHK